MGFESGSISLTAYYIPRELPTDALDRFKRDALGPLENLRNEALHGWVTGRHLLDTNINEDTAYVANRLRLALVKAERKVPEALLRAECKMEELAVMAAEGKEVLPRSERSAIKKAIHERLLPDMPPTLTAIPIVYDAGLEMMFAGATSDKQVDALIMQFRQTTGISPVPVTPTTAALRRKQLSIRDVAPTSFSPDVEDIFGGDEIGHDFLTWLWFFFEQEGGMLRIGDDMYGVALEGPLTFFMEGQGAHLAVLRNGQPLVSSEAKAALLAGKKLKQARVIISRHEETWTAGVDAGTFVLRGLKIPKGEALDAVSRFEERMLSLARFTEVFLSFYDRFIDVRTAPERWSKTRAAIHDWVRGRVGKGGAGTGAVSPFADTSEAAPLES